MAESWKEAKEWAEKEALPQVYHDCDNVPTVHAIPVSDREHSKAVSLSSIAVFVCLHT